MTFSTSLLLAFALLPAGPPAAGGPMILDFNATWCGPCRQMRPVVERLVDKDYPVRSIDIDQSRALAQRYRITGVPTFVVVDGEGRELGRLSGVQPAGELAKLYNDACAQLDAAPSRRSEAPERSVALADASGVPKPWQTVVRIKVYGKGSVGFGSGTVIYSDDEEAVILTCAHIFHVDGVRKQPAPRQFNQKIQVDLFDGRLHGLNPAVVHPVESHSAEVLDYDFPTDVGLIRIRPGRALPFSPVVPENWAPREGVAMTTVGCSEGNNATAWSTKITNSQFRGVVNGNTYDAIECEFAPKQGRSGGGLYTLEGFVAGVCNFAEPQGGHGLYAAPKAIYRMLDRNELQICYQAPPAGRDRMLASNDSGRAGRRDSRTTVRAQSASMPGGGEIPMPDPDRLGVTLEPIASMTERQRPKNPEPARAGQGWRTAGMPEKEVERELLASNRSDGAFAEDLLPQGPGAVPADLQMSPEAAGDSNVLLRDEPEGDEARRPASSGSWRTGSR